MERAILHLDGDSFFAACEVARNPGLRGKPVVTGRERGIVCAATYEAKKLGIYRAMPIYKVMREFPQVVILPGDYDLYGMYAKRLYAITRRYARVVEEYGIDECFADLTGQDRELKMSYEEIARRIKRDLSIELALIFSAGLAPTKALAKLASKWKKPNGFSVIRLGEERACLAGTPIDKVWGIGRALSVQLEAQNIATALDFVERDPTWIAMKFSKPTIELQRELSGELLWNVEDGAPATPHSIQRTGTFTPATRECKLVWAHFCRNVEDACAAARREGLIPARASFFIKSQDFHYAGDEVKLPYPSDMPNDVLRVVRPRFLKRFAHGTRYRATGVTLFSFRGEHDIQLDIFDERKESRGRSRVFAAADSLARKYGEQVLSLASSMLASDARDRGIILHEEAYRERFRIPGLGAKHLPLPVLGEAV